MIWACAARYDPAIEAAYLSAFGVDVLDPGVTPRRIAVLMRHLPAGSLLRPDEDESWSVEAHLLAGLIDSVNQLTWLTSAVNSGKGRRPKRPKPIPRPSASKPATVSTGGMTGLRSLAGLLKEEA